MSMERYRPTTYIAIINQRRVHSIHTRRFAFSLFPLLICFYFEKNYVANSICGRHWRAHPSPCPASSLSLSLSLFLLFLLLLRLHHHHLLYPLSLSFSLFLPLSIRDFIRLFSSFLLFFFTSSTSLPIPQIHTLCFYAVYSCLVECEASIHY